MAWKYVYLFDIPLFIRNQGIFWEPGVLQIFLNILLFQSLFIYHKRKITLLSIFVLITTWSSTGMVIMLLQLVVFYATNIKKKRFLVFIPVSLLIAFGMIYILQSNLQEKLEGDKASSSVQRSIDTLSTLYLIKEYPWFGIGLDSNNYTNLLSKHTIFITGRLGALRESAGISNSLLYYFVFFGIPIGLFFLYALYRQFLIRTKQWLFFLIVTTSSLTEPVLLLTFFSLFMISGLINMIKPRVRI
ncbi:O-antigen ligase family protein [Sulfurimonas sp. ST-25]|uniref:O-antigen ligase family protein n=1 Tax=Sulfurimonas sp. ST-25 TaxID=3400151 RepID=UPI003A866E79